MSVADVVILAAALLGAMAAALVVHELGHAAAAIAVGGARIRVQRSGLFGVGVGADGIEGRRARVVFFAGGALFNVGCACVLLLASSGSWPLLLAAGMQVLMALLSLAPGEHSDGAALARALHGG